MIKQLYLSGRIIVVLVVIVSVGCTTFKKVIREITTPVLFKRLSENQIKQMKKSSPFMKVHMNNGYLYVLDEWETDTTRQNLIGTGILFNTQRDTINRGQFQMGIDSVALFETNELKNSGTPNALTLFTMTTLALTISCISNPKACFGSCPTFYALAGDSLHLQAEGFSASITPSLEATDIDALYHASPTGDEFEIEMRNEAFETHVVRYADILAVPRASTNRVYADLAGHFWESAYLRSPVSANAAEGDCLPLLLEADGKERCSKTDSTYLGTKEIIEIEFNNIPNEPCGLVIGCRQSLLSTYLLYQTFAYMGNDVGYWFSQIARKNIKQSQNPIQKILGGIEILIQNSGSNWKVIDQINEQGPLAIDVHLVPLGRITGESIKVRLRMTKGNWRIDYIALATLIHAVQPIRLQPYVVFRNSTRDENAQAILCDSSRALVTLPGDIYTLKYNIPGVADNYELFLQSRGYYLEWIRQEWIEEENPMYLAELLLNPEKTLKRLAPEFKNVEEQMEECFWRSRYARP